MFSLNFNSNLGGRWAFVCFEVGGGGGGGKNTPQNNTLAKVSNSKQ